MRQIFFLTAVLAFFTINAQNQEVISSSGDHYDNGSVQLSWTLGEIVTETATDDNVIITQGFHQSNLTITKIEEDYLNNINASVNIFPNPTSDLATIELKDVEIANFIYELNDNKGKTIIKKNFESETEVIDFSQYAASIYYIRIYSKAGDYSETFKVIKDKN